MDAETAKALYRIGKAVFNLDFMDYDADDDSGIHDGLDSDVEMCDSIDSSLDISEELNLISEQDSGLNISFGRSEHEVQDDISWHKKRLNSAKKDIDYYSRELRRKGLTDTYTDKCETCLKQAATRYDEENNKLKSLVQELDKIIKGKKEKTS